MAADYVMRPLYTDVISDFIDVSVIKILTGMRRVGKSTILLIIKDKLLSEVPEQNKIYINFEAREYRLIRNADDLFDYLDGLSVDDSQKCYYFFDEIQLVDGWERVVNALRLNENNDIYITGSNSSIMSGELSSLLAGRYVEFEIQPFTFKEFNALYSYLVLSVDELFNRYVQIGGIPAIKYLDLKEEPIRLFLKDIYNTIVVKDVMAYNQIRDIDTFNRILLYVVESVGHTFSLLSISKYLKSEGITVSVNTIGNYLDCLEKAFVIKRVSRFNVAGKKVMKTDEKFYLTDHGIRNALGFSNTANIDQILENIVYQELVSRGYEVYIGKNANKEIDFVAKKGANIEYYQVTYVMESDKTRKREFGAFDGISDNYPKYVLSLDRFDFSHNGYIHKNLIDFLLEE